MDKSYLKKHSKSQLIKLLLKQEKKKPKTIVVDDTKPIDKPIKKQKKAFNHDILLNDDPFPDFVITNDPFEKTMNKVHKSNKRIKSIDDKITEKYNALTESKKDVIIY